MAQIADHADAQVNRVLVANKSDNEAERRVSSAEGAALRRRVRGQVPGDVGEARHQRVQTFTAIAREVVARRFHAEGAASTTSTCRGRAAKSRRCGWVAGRRRRRGVDARRDLPSSRRALRRRQNRDKTPRRLRGPARARLR